MSFKKDDTVTLMTKDGAERTGVVTKADETEVTVKLDPEAAEAEGDLPAPEGADTGDNRKMYYATTEGKGRRRGKKTRKSKKSKRSTRRRA